MNFVTITDCNIIKHIVNKNVPILYLKYKNKRAFYSYDNKKWHMSSIERIKTQLQFVDKSQKCGNI